jgi:sigma-B regulation protein RsbU (phosphoserine phosphatase)
MIKQEKDLRKERDRRIEYELDLARQVQRSMLSGPLQEKDITISSVYRPTFELAGDFYAWYQISPEQYGVILLDMMGHGISSSLVGMYIYSALKDTITPDSLMNYYFTAIYFVLDTKKQTIEYVNAGHPEGIAIVDQEVKLLTEGSCAIGFFEEIQVTKGVIPYTESARILLFTDGLSEWMEDKYENATDMLIGALEAEDMQDPAALLHQLQPGWELINPPKDDMCLVLISTNAPS